VDFNEDDRESHATRQPFKATGYPFLTFLRAVFEELGGQTLCSADDEGADEAAVDDAGGLAVDHFKLGVLLIQDIYPADCLLLRNQGFDGLFVAVQRDAEDGGVPLLAEVIGHLGNDEGFAHFVSGVDALYTTFFVTGDLIDYFCHILLFSAKITEPSAEIRQKLRNSVKNGNILAGGAAQLELLSLSCVNMAEEMPLGFCLQNEVEYLRGAQIFIEDAVWWIMSNKDVKIDGDIFIGNPCVPGNSADNYTVAILYGILQNSDAGSLKLAYDVIGLVQVKR